MKTFSPTLAIALTAFTLSAIGTARAQNAAPPAGVEFRFSSIEPDRNGTRNLNVSAGFPEHSELILSGQLLKAIADDGTDLFPKKDNARCELIRHPEFLHLFNGKMRNNMTIPLKSFDSAQIHALRELAGTFTCLVGEWKDIDLGLTGFVAGQRGKLHGARIESIKPWTLGNGTQMLKLFLDVPLSASDHFVMTDAAGQTLPVRMVQQEVAPGGSITAFILQTGSFPPAGKIVGKILEGKPVEMPFAFSNFGLAPAGK